MIGQILVLMLLTINPIWNAQSQLTKEERFKLVQKLTDRLQIQNTEDISDASLVEALQLLSVQNEKKQATSYFPIVVNTWGFVNATAKAWDSLDKYDDSLAAVVSGCTECEDLQCDGTVGIYLILKF